MGSAMEEGSARLRSRGSVKSCLRTLEVIEYFVAHGRPARTIEISEALGMPNSSADEILRTLAGSGYLIYNRTSKLYAPSYKIVHNASAIERSFFCDSGLREMLENMRRETGASVFLTQQNDYWVESVAEVDGGWSKAPDEDAAYSHDMICFARNSWRPATNFSAAMLAQHSNVAIVQLATRIQRMGVGPAGPALMKNLVDRVAHTRSRGYAFCRRSETVPVDSIAVPLRVPHAVTTHAVGIVGDPLFNSDSDVRAMLAAMQAVIFQHSGGSTRSTVGAVQ